MPSSTKFYNQANGTPQCSTNNLQSPVESLTTIKTTTQTLVNVKIEEMKSITNGALNGANPSEVGIGSNATSVDTVGRNASPLDAVAAVAPVVQLIKDATRISDAVRETCASAADSTVAIPTGKQSQRVCDHYAELVGALDAANKASTKVVKLAAKIVTAVSEVPCDDANEAILENCENTSDVSQDSRVSVDITAPVPPAHGDRVKDKQHRVLDLDKDTEIVTQGVMEMVHFDLGTDRNNYRPDQTVSVSFLNGNKDTGRVGLLPVGQSPADSPLIRPTVVKSEWDKVDLAANCKADILKSTVQYNAWFVPDRGPVSMTGKHPIKIDRLRNIKSFSSETRFQTQSLYTFISSGVIKPENIVGKSKTCNKIRLYDGAIDDIVNDGHLPRKKGRAKLEKFLANRHARA